MCALSSWSLRLQRLELAPQRLILSRLSLQGYKGKSRSYIACQAPLPETVQDFWRMIWEQQCKVVIMLTACEENGVVTKPKVFLFKEPPNLEGIALLVPGATERQNHLSCLLQRTGDDVGVATLP